MKKTVYLDDALNTDANGKIKNLEGVSSNQELRPHNQRHTDLLGGKNVVVTSKKCPKKTDSAGKLIRTTNHNRSRSHNTGREYSYKHSGQS